MHQGRGTPCDICAWNFSRVDGHTHSKMEGAGESTLEDGLPKRKKASETV